MYTARLDPANPGATEVETLLRARLGHAVDLAARLRQAYWSATDRELIEIVHDDVDACMTLLAGRIAAVSGLASRAVLAAAVVRPAARYPLKGSHVTAVGSMLEEFRRLLRADIGQVAALEDADTLAVLAEILERLDPVDSRTCSFGASEARPGQEP
jgi:hypothetical protein